jgi:hypothetical protein
MSSSRWAFDDFEQHLTAAAAFHGLWVLNSFRDWENRVIRAGTGPKLASTYLHADRLSALAVDDLERAW